MNKLIKMKDKHYKENLKTYIDTKRNAKSYDYKTGDQVLVKDIQHKNKLTPYWENRKYQIVKQYQSSLKLKSPSGKEIIRNKGQIKKYNDREKKSCIDIKRNDKRPPPEVNNQPYCTIALDFDNNDETPVSCHSSDTNHTSDSDTHEYSEDSLTWNFEEQKRTKRITRKPAHYRDSSESE